MRFKRGLFISAGEWGVYKNSIGMRSVTAKRVEKSGFVPSPTGSITLLHNFATSPRNGSSIIAPPKK